jgi:uncharacterized protein
MENITQGKFFNPTKGDIVFEQVVKEVFSYIKEKPNKKYEVIVGCDSSSGESPTFPVAVVVLRIGEGGRFFLKRVRYKNRIFYNIHERILEEAYLSCQLALKTRDALKEQLTKEIEPCDYEFRYIHADISEGGKTKDMIKEVVGLIRGNGFEAKIKPEAYVASIVADRFS